jgi:beta-lactamase regulating signal transducer with metallopeptidase domain
MNAAIATLMDWLQHTQAAAQFLDLLLKSFVVLLVAWGVCFCLRRVHPSIRHLIWFTAMAGLLCLPVLSRVLPSWQKPLWTVASRSDAGNELTFTLKLVPASSPAGAGHAVITGAAPANANLEPVARPILATRFRLGWTAVVLAVWLAGVSLKLFSILAGQLQVRSLYHTARPFSRPEWLARLREISAEMQINRPVVLLQCDRDLMPSTWGSLRPVILLPNESDEWSPGRIKVVLRHELAHIKRFDCLSQLIARIACALYWFNPLAWLAERRMCVERERACDDLVLSGGACKPSEYAAQLVEIARGFRQGPAAAAIAMARASHPEGRIAAMLDASRSRRTPGLAAGIFCSFAALAFVSGVAAQKPEPKSSGTVAAGKPWFDGRLRAFFAAKSAHAHHLVDPDHQKVAPEVWPYFEAGMRGDWATATNLWIAMRQRAHQYEGAQPDGSLDKVWSPILETDLAWEDFAHWSQKYVLAYGNDIIKSIPPGSIYFGGTDPGRGLVTAFSESHEKGIPFLTLTQNALADSTYLDYLRATYGAMIPVPTMEDSTKALEEYTAGARRRLSEHKLIPGEDVQIIDGKVEVKGQVAVMAINGLLSKNIFDRNPGRQFYIEESFPMDWMYPYLSPNGLIMKINRAPLPELPVETVQKDHEYWLAYLRPILGNWLDYNTSVADVAAFVQKVHLKHDLSGFTGDPLFIRDTWAQKAFSKLRSGIGGNYAWRLQHAKTAGEKQQMAKEADLAFRQAYALCPISPEAVFRYVNLLIASNRFSDAELLVATSLKFDPDNATFKGLDRNLKNLAPAK